MSWGKGIAFSLMAFVAMIGTLAYMSTQQRFDLVTDRYYEASLAYDEVQNKRSNYSRLEIPASVEVDIEKKNLSLILPLDFLSSPVKGTVQLYSPVDSRLDRHFELSQPFTISTSDLKKGKWQLIVDWEKEGKGYLFEYAFFIN
jgi:hypothetical protein